MPRHHEVRELPYSADQMFDLVADVARYGEFLPWVVGVRVRSDSASEMVADVIVGFKGLRENFTSRVHKTHPSHIHVDYLDGPLRHLSNDWRFHALSGGRCTVDFTVDFAFRSSLFERLAGQMFDKALRRMTAAFEARAAALYGSNSSSANAVA
ncbi:MAG: type II toxin-antitoxin system RatA family toxin [Sphingopyxis sp.]